MCQTATVRQLASIPAPSKPTSAAPIWPLKFRLASEGRILSLFCTLTAEQRRARFGAQLADGAIESWRTTIDREFYLPVTYEQGSQLVGLVELFGCKRAGWKRPELAITVGQASDSARVRQHLMEIGLAAARDLGAVDVLVYFDDLETAAMACARHCGGALDHESGIAVVSCEPVATDLCSWSSRVESVCS